MSSPAKTTSNVRPRSRVCASAAMHVVAPLPSVRRELRVELHSDGRGRDRGDRGVHPVGSIDAGAGTDVEDRPVLEVGPHEREPLRVASRLPVLGLERVPRRHRAERRRTVIAAAALVLVAAACSEPPAARPLPPTPSRRPRPCRRPRWSRPRSPETPVTAKDGEGRRVVHRRRRHRRRRPSPLPPGVGSTAIVHVRRTTAIDAFVVSAVDAQGRQLAVLAHSLGSYDGTFPVGFVNQKGTPVAGSGSRHDRPVAPRHRQAHPRPRAHRKRGFGPGRRSARRTGDPGSRPTSRTPGPRDSRSRPTPTGP